MSVRHLVELDVRKSLKLGSDGVIRTWNITRQFTETADHMLRLV